MGWYQRWTGTAKNFCLLIHTQFWLLLPVSAPQQHQPTWQQSYRWELLKIVDLPREQTAETEPCAFLPVCHVWSHWALMWGQNTSVVGSLIQRVLIKGVSKALACWWLARLIICVMLWKFLRWVACYNLALHAWLSRVEFSNEAFEELRKQDGCSMSRRAGSCVFPVKCLGKYWHAAFLGPEFDLQKKAKGVQSKCTLPLKKQLGHICLIGRSCRELSLWSTA